MKYISVPSLGEDVSCLALGVNKTGPRTSATQDSESARIFLYHRAIDLGINLFDTAELYGGGYSEEILGKALQGCRDQALICTKFNARNATKKNLRKSLEGSLRRLKTEYIDFYVAHWPNPTVVFEETIQALQKFKDEGKIGAYGLSNAVISEIRDFKDNINDNFFLIENEYNLVERDVEREILPFVEKNNCLFMTYSPLIQGRLSCFHDEIGTLQRKYDCSFPQLVLAWVLRKNMVSIVRTNNLDHLRENVGSLDLCVEPSDFKILENCFRIDRQFIDLDKIQLDKRSYMTVTEALANGQDLIPSPQLLAERIKRGLSIPPLRVFREGKKYKILDEFYMSEIKKLWAWRIAMGNNNKMEAYIFNDL